RRRRLLDCRYRDLAVGLALRMADGRSQRVSQREALVHDHRQAAGGAEGLQGPEGRRRRAGAGWTNAAIMPWRWRALHSIAVIACLACAPGAQAEDTIDRPVTIYVAGTAGGGIDLYARLVSRHIGRHIPGRPTVTVQVMPGA